MGKLLPTWRQALIDEMVSNIQSNTSHYYGFAGLSYDGSTANNDYVSLFNSDWNMLFGKKLANTDILPVVKNNLWVSNTVYDIYDNTSNTLYSDNNFYVLSPPVTTGAAYQVYKCIDNANGSPSTVQPTLYQQATFQTSDGYKWRYIASVTYKDYVTIATPQYTPIYDNPTIVASAQTYCGVEVVMVTNNGIGYSTYNDGTIKSVVNSTVVEIEPTASTDSDFYTKSGIYIYNTTQSTSQLFGITKYVSNTSGKWVYLDSVANTQNISPNLTEYKISPRVVFTSDSNTSPLAYTVVNSVSNTINSVVVLDPGSFVTWANVSIQCNTAHGTGANAYAIVPPPGGHGSNPVSELGAKGVCFNFAFSNTESNTIVSNVSYDMIGILKKPYYLDNVTFAKGSIYTDDTFSQVLVANVSLTYSVGELVTGATSGCLGKVVFANSSQVELVGDKKFANGENLIASNGAVSTLDIKSRAQVYSKDLLPIYIQNINSITRSNTQTESYTVIVQF